MKLVKIASSYLRQAYSRLRDAEEALEEGNYPYALRLSQECVELSLKASLKLVGIEYPKVHDVSDVLLDYRGRFPEWFEAEVEFMAEVSSSLAAKRELAFYGGEEALLAPEELISREEAERAVEGARKVYALCSKLLSAYLEGRRRA
mgnify:CR=1 FL=1